MLRYSFDSKSLEIRELHNGQDMEFWLKLCRPDADVELAVKQIRSHFDDNDVMTDVLFYAHPEYEYQWIVREDFYTDFVLRLFRHKPLTSVHWEE
ncbi:hypothetical protein LJK88_12755 [Paenibacillus sp. P26]|nr:hypothetical protein LJK88_12755 [Paenibacillus sp. P26]